MTRQKRILFIGDSLLAFYDWQKDLQEFECINLGVPGETVEGWLSLTDQASKRYADANYLVVMLGANNLCRHDFSFLDSYGQLLRDLQGLYPNAEVVVCSLLPHELSWLAGSAVVRLNESLQEIVERGNAVFLDVHSAFQKKSGECFVEDGVHLSEMGYEIWSNILSLFFKAGCKDCC